MVGIERRIKLLGIIAGLSGVESLYGKIEDLAHMADAGHPDAMSAIDHYEAKIIEVFS